MLQAPSNFSAHQTTRLEEFVAFVSNTQNCAKMGILSSTFLFKHQRNLFSFNYKLIWNIVTFLS